MQTDFIHVPLPLIGTRQHADVAAILRSDEVKPFRLKTLYDRPIPRRLLEEAGVPRGTFGRTKKAASLLLFQDRNTWSPEPRRALAMRLRRLGPRELAGYHARGLVAHPSPRLRVDAPPVAIRELLGDPDYVTFEHSHPSNAVLFLMGLDMVQERYRA